MTALWLLDAAALGFAAGGLWSMRSWRRHSARMVESWRQHYLDEYQREKAHLRELYRRPVDGVRS